MHKLSLHFEPAR